MAQDIDGVPIKQVYFRSKDGAQLHGWFLQPGSEAKEANSQDKPTVSAEIKTSVPGPNQKQVSAQREHSGSLSDFQNDIGTTEDEHSTSQNNRWVVLISHGNGGNITYYASLCSIFLNLGASVFTYDYEGYGQSTGTPSLQNICDDGEAAYHWLVDKQGFTGDRIIDFGQSLGTGVACYLAEREKFAAVILLSPFTSLIRIAKQKLFVLKPLPLGLLRDPHLDNEKAMKHPHAPLLLIHGDRDDLIPVAHSEEIFRTALQPKTFVRLPESGHNDTYRTNNKEFVAALKDFLGKVITPKASDTQVSN